MLISDVNIKLYIKNRRDSSNLKGCSPLQFYGNSIGKCHEVAYFAYTKRWRAL